MLLRSGCVRGQIASLRYCETENGRLGMLACSYHRYPCIECLYSNIYIHGCAGCVLTWHSCTYVFVCHACCAEVQPLFHVCTRDRCCTVFAVLAVPDRPGPPVVVNVTHHSVELKWDAPSHDLETGKLRYCLQEEGEKSKGFTNVYK